MSKPEEENLERTSPVKRLMALLHEIRGQNPNIRILNGWKNIFGLPNNTSITDVYPHILSVKELINECLKLVEEVTDPENKREYRSHLLEIESIVNYVNLDANMQTLQHHITDLALQGLKFCNTEISKHVSENRIESEEIQRLINDIRNLKTELLDADINPDVKRFIIELLTSIESALIDYKILGIEGIEKNP